MSFRALVATPNAELESSLLLRFDEVSECEVVSTLRSSREVSDAVAELPVLDVVLIHADLGPLPVFDLIRDLSVHYPQLAIILIAPEVLPETYTSAMEAGARGVLAADATLEELRTRVTTAAEWSRSLRSRIESSSAEESPTSGRRGAILTLSGAKGGVGVTTTAVHLALNAAQAGGTVCLVDLDLQTGDLPAFLDLKHRRGIVDLVEAGDTISAAMLADTLYVHPAGPHILLAPPEGERGEEVGERATRQILASLRSRYDLTIVDCGAQSTDASTAAVELADRSVVILTPDLPALRGAQRLTTLWERLHVRQKKDVSALMVRQHRRNEIQPDLARKLLGTTLLRTAVPANFRAYEEAANTGDPSRMTDDSQRKAHARVLGELGLVGASGAATQNGQRPTQVGTTNHFGREAESFLSGGNRRIDDRGGTLLELASLTPLLLLMLLLVWQVLLIGLTGMYAGHAANEGARQAALTPDDHERIVEEATKRVMSPWDQEDTFTVEVEDRTDGQYVAVSIAMPVVLPGTTGPWDVTGESRVVPQGAGGDTAEGAR
ncbi:AAA family ATPase [Spiractinospora alimapuensis]|uniref:AAA family ATPase n=1 Tax=Spiractinospora alimapuensis TaxID=2820884 RepID=UPI001F224BE3|nr:AAA family ATPase [Spiractinospora alimapuensis]QVQ53766.1 AAA family ATPase [Spiractinospora alimapuensis]